MSRLEVIKDSISQELIDTPEKYAEAKRYINGRSDMLTMDTETNGLDVYRKRMVGTGILSGQRAFYLPFRHALGTVRHYDESNRNLPEELVGDMCETILRPDRLHCGYHYGFDIKMMAKEGMQVPHRIIDPQLSAHLLNENEDSFKLETVCAKYGIGIDPEGADERLTNMLLERYGGARDKAKSHLWKLTGEETLEYGTQDLISTRDLGEWQLQHLGSWKLSALAEEVADFQLAIVDMEMRGCLLDLPLMGALRQEAQAQADSHEQQLCELAGYKINPRSPKQLQAWLGMKSTSKAALIAMGDDPRVKLLRDYRQWQKVEGTYYKKFAQVVDEHDRLHANLRVTGTTTSRLTCTNPNLQALPREIEPGTAYVGVKQIIIPPPGYVFLELDLSQAEIRVMAHYTHDEQLLEILNKGLNMHTVVAESMGIDRHIAKQLNLSAQYGIGAKTFGETYGYSRWEAKKYLDGYHRALPGVRRLYKQCDEVGQVRGHLRLFTGRVRHFNHRRAPTHNGSNALVQGAIAEMIRRSITRVKKEVPEFEMILTVHDCICGYALVDHWRPIARAVKDIMEDQPWCNVATVADCKMSEKSWADAKEVEL